MTGPPDHEAWRIPAWRTVTRVSGFVAFAAGALALYTEGPLRRGLLMAILLMALVPALMTHRAGAPRVAVDVGGRGYVRPGDWRLRAIHVAITVLYNAGIVLVVGAALLRADVIEGDLSGAPRVLFPFLLGSTVLLLTAALLRGVEDRGGIRRDWSTRVHGIVVAVVAVPLVVLGAFMVARQRLSAGPYTLTESDFLVLVTVGVLGVVTQLMLALRLPTTWDLLRRVSGAEGRDLEGRRHETPPVLYALVATVTGLAILGFILDRTGLLRGLALFGGDRIVLLVALLPVGVLVFLALSALSIYREGRRGLIRQRAPKEVVRSLTIYTASGMLGLTFGVLLVLVQSGRIDHIGPIEADIDLVKDLAVLTIVSTFGPIGVHLHRQQRRMDAIDGRIPDLLGDLAEKRQAGLTLASALQGAAEGDYGALTPEVRKMAHQVSWGVSFMDALRLFAERRPTPLVRRSTALVIEAGRTGGSVSEVLRAAAKDAYEVKALESERQAVMTTYLVVLYVVFAVFLVVVGILDVRFIPQVLAASEVADIEGSFSFAGVDREQLRFIYFNAAVVQSVGNGLVGGVLATGRVTGGFRHVAIMAGLAWVVFRVLLPLS